MYGRVHELSARLERRILRVTHFQRFTRRRMQLALPTISLLMLILAACSSTPSNSIEKNVLATTLPSGWRVDCLPDQYTAVTRCFAGTFGAKEGTSRKNVPFQVYFLNKDGPKILAGFNTYPGKVALVRVDNTAPLPATKSTELVSRLQSGATAYVTYYVWPEGPERMRVDLSGFPEAYALLREKLGAN
jgi:hypothetical protein